MNQALAHAGNLAPRNLLVCVAKGRRDFGRSLSNNLQRSNDRILMQTALEKCASSSPAAKPIASVAASDMSSSRARSRSIDGLGFGQNASAANVVPAAFKGFALDKIDWPAEDRFQRFLEVQELGQVFCRRCKGNEEISVAAPGIEVSTAGGRAENLQPPDTETATQRGNSLAFLGDGGVHARFPD
jgi:hypothetical protein